MGKTLIALIGGVSLAALALVLFEEAPEITPPEPAGESPRPDTRMHETIPDSRSRIATEDEDTGESETRAATTVEGEPPTLEELEKRVAETQRAWLRAQEELQRARNVARWANEPPPVLAIQLPPEFDWLSQNPSNAHELIQREPIDPIWSARAEAELYRYFTEQPGITAKYGLANIHCRTTRCEIAFVARGADDPVLAAERGLTNEFVTLMSFQSANSEFYNHPSAKQFGFVSNNENNRGITPQIDIKDDVTMILWHLVKNEEQMRIDRRAEAP